MKKLLLVTAIAVAALMMFYGGVSALVNQGHGLGKALLTFTAVIAGGVGLVWMVKSGR
ncbi:hypothetical protein [Thiolapillus brandeum]|uniref:hypothetical protein n=1 Tax=Thiolapillus brandeum TaxID=1076588 RepID=UPI0012B5747A|nr:hypothetical protein [Thiolapillus brandeum]